jgi:hypothetical protein
MHSRIHWLVVYVAVAFAAFTVQAQPPGTTSTLGVVMKVDVAARQIVLKTDAGAEVTVTMQPTASFRRTEPGETDLRNAAAIAITDINAGDRALARGKASEDQKSVAATLIVIISQSDIAKKQAGERADWDKRGVSGIVTAIAGDQITVTARGKPLIITPAPNAAIRRYTPESVKFTDAKPSTLADVKVGDQVRALGNKNDDGTKLTAEEIVSGSFRTIAATVISIDAQNHEMRVNDLATKKPAVVKINPDSNLRKLPLQMAQMLAARNRPPEDGAEPGGRGRAGVAPPEGRGGSADGARGGGMRGGSDLSQMLDRTPTVTLAELKPGDAIIVLSTESSGRLSAITLLAGVEPILTKPGTREMALGAWSLGSIGGDQ